MVRVTSGNRNVTASRKTPNQFSRRLFAPLPSRYNLLAAALSFGQDRRWRSAMLDHVVGSDPKLILDVACGPGAVTKALAKRTSARVVGLDLSEEMLREGQANVTSSKIAERVSLVLGRGEQLPFADATFDALTFTYLLRYVEDPQATMSELARVVKPGGPIASLEFGVPPKIGWRLAWWLYTRAVLPVAGYLTGGKGWWDVGRFLGPSISSHYKRYPLHWLLRAWEHAGVEHVEYRSMSLGGGIVTWGYRTR
ncbi:MAG TPA: class I SAM-dependent methyltransferase [Acidimicrobiales bacterium]|nr:class I SAM-dependent methyltransferase [Acidimicrobiales bacterium]